MITDSTPPRTLTQRDRPTVTAIIAELLKVLAQARAVVERSRGGGNVEKQESR